MNKKIFLLLLVCVVTLISVIVYTTHQRLQPLTVLSTSITSQVPQNPYLPVTVTFNRAPKGNEVAVSISPDIKTRTTTEGNTIKISPETTFASEASYTISINTSPPYVFSFTTQTTIENSPNWNTSFEQSLEQYQQNNASQDAALVDMRKNAPIYQNGFTVNYSYATSTYTITLSPPYEQNKQNFLSWFSQKGVTKLTGLRINYVNK